MNGEIGEWDFRARAGKWLLSPGTVAFYFRNAGSFRPECRPFPAGLCTEKTLAEKNDYQKLIEQIFVYQKSLFAPIKEEQEYTIDKFIWRIIEKQKGFESTIGGKKVTIFKSGQYEIVQESPSINLLKETWATGSVLKANASGKFFNEFIAPRKEIDGLGCLYKVSGIGDDGIGYRYFSGPKREDATKGKFYSGVPNDRRVQLANGNAVKYKPIANFMDLSDSFGNCRQEGGVDFGSGKKPVALLSKIILSASTQSESELICDFFAGSGSLGHAVWECNQKDGGNRRFILVQLPEPILNNEFKTISDLTIGRLQRAGKKIRDENPMFQGDMGFRAFRLDSSNIRPWNPEWDTLEDIIRHSVDHIMDGRSEADILYELLLKLGLDLSVPIEERKISEKKVYAIGAGTLVVCLDKKIDRKDAEPLALGIVEWHKQLAPVGESTCVFLDSAFADDVVKTNLSAILQQYGLENVRSL